MKALPNIKLKPSFHKEKEVVQIIFDKNKEVQDLLRANTAMRWSQTMNCWYVPASKTLTQDLYRLLRNKAYLDHHELKESSLTKQPYALPVSIQQNTSNTAKALQELLPETEQKLIEFKQWLRSRRYSESTIGTYTDALRIFLRYFGNKTVSEITNQDLILFNNKYIIENKLSASFQNQVVNGIKLFFRTIEDKKLDADLIHRPKRPKLLPNVLSKEEVKAILNALRNIKHKAMLSLIYSCGLRRSELLNLKLTDIDSKRHLIIVRQSKGRKDRIVPLSDKILQLLREYFNAFEPKEWLFEGQDKKSQYDESSLVAVLKQAVEKCKINKPVTLDWLRHSYATHLLENGTDLRYIQEILGHSRSTVTEIYTHVSNKSIQKVISPFDTL